MLKFLRSWHTRLTAKDPDAKGRSVHGLLAFVLLAVLCLCLFFAHSIYQKREAEKAELERSLRLQQAEQQQRLEEAKRAAQQPRTPSLPVPSQPGNAGTQPQPNVRPQNPPQGQTGGVPLEPKVKAQTPTMIQPGKGVR
ncbi:MAG: hypothetical protein LKE88_07310 [Acidaminococcus provencensis]|jgi:heme exporter protein D|uniref:hypothetical protein n=1 Tax=Acidaminococcus TaxID=904 RepID=UPI000E497752|nr:MULTISPECIES: hypothetical protein [Acidaminococcus]MCH4096433.1 hypothetical protein [Acidaminococcus provencensis]RHK02891.1 hypothetical protein DW089_02665 [Acidaminococcus sp. AM05-11]